LCLWAISKFLNFINEANKVNVVTLFPLEIIALAERKGCAFILTSKSTHNLKEK